MHVLRLKRQLRDDISYPSLNLSVGYSKGNKIITVLPVFRENLVAICTHDRRLWIWIYPCISVDISMDIHGKSVDMDIDMDGKFHIHDKPGKTHLCLLLMSSSDL